MKRSVPEFNPGASSRTWYQIPFDFGGPRVRSRERRLRWNNHLELGPGMGTSHWHLLGGNGWQSPADHLGGLGDDRRTLETSVIALVIAS